MDHFAGKTYKHSCVKLLNRYLRAFLLVSLFMTEGRVYAEISADHADSGRYEAGIEISVQRVIELPSGGYHEDLFVDGENIWVNNGRAINTWIVSKNDGNVIGEIIPPGTFTEGISDSATSGMYWVTDWDTKNLYRVRLDGNKMIPEFEISFAPALPTGVARIRDRLYVLTWTRAILTTYHLHELDKNGTVLRRMRMRGIPEPSQMCWDGSHLWITSWKNRRVYRVEIDDLTVTGHFVSPAEDTTGIAVDGDHFWITGTYDHLYKIKVSGHPRDPGGMNAKLGEK